MFYYFVSLPLVLYLKLNERMGENIRVSSFESSIFFPPNTGDFAYAFYVLFNVITFVLLCLIKKAKVIDESGRLMSKSTVIRAELLLD